MSTPQPPYPGIAVPGRYRWTPYVELPEAIRAIVDAGPPPLSGATK